ncbi:DUF808 family protein [Plebeiibacterium sediminum]|uniref:DUF808 domain-containing protein n=1 Tax=Plebeiibacterium sediminum TaxID=2992112 RepID=A0AAE3M7Y0_9BACT|nr:DUF808 family protein [Plebeiobacterium sediminum]MCW3788909.1 DUF808 domain-containing protein [Plebeiobacterium sediminum]
MASGFFALFDDVATLMDDLATMSKIATKKTAGILGDDLAVNAEKATGFVSARELPVIWAITKGSFLNKMIILPIIILLSLFAPQAVVPILLVGGLYLAYEGAEKVYDYIFKQHSKEKTEQPLNVLNKEDILTQEKQKIKSAIATDFILSLEIVIIGLSTVADRPLVIQIPVLIVVAIATTIGVYGIVALIVRLDDMGYKIIAKGEQVNKTILKKLGLLLVKSLPVIIKILAVVGTLAMLVVAGGIYVHHIQIIHEWIHFLPSIFQELSTGLVIGLIAVITWRIIVRIKNKVKHLVSVILF